MVTYIIKKDWFLFKKNKKYKVYIDSIKTIPHFEVPFKDVWWKDISLKKIHGAFYKNEQVSFTDFNLWKKEKIIEELFKYCGKEYIFKYCGKEYIFKYLTTKEYSKMHPIFCQIFDKEDKLVGSMEYNYKFLEEIYRLKINESDIRTASVLAIAIILRKNDND